MIGFSPDCRRICCKEVSPFVDLIVMCTSGFFHLFRTLMPSLRNKAVADGAMSFYLDHRVSARVAKKTYGVKCNTRFDPNDPTHLSRSETNYTGISGYLYLPNKFDTILAKVRIPVRVLGSSHRLFSFLPLQGTRVSEDKEFRRNYVINHRNPNDCGTITSDVTSYHGSQEPQWTDTEPRLFLTLPFNFRLLTTRLERFSTLCIVEADTTPMIKAIKPSRGLDGLLFYPQQFGVVLLFGLTELKAQLSWTEDVSGLSSCIPSSLT